MAWWNDPAYTRDLAPAELDAEHAAHFPDYVRWQRDPGTDRLRRIGARDILAGLTLGEIPRGASGRAKWAGHIPPLPGAVAWSRKNLDWLLKHAVCVPVFVPVVDGQHGRLIRFDCIAPRAGESFPASFPASAAETHHGESIQKARKALQRLEPDIPPDARVYAEDGGAASRGDSASLGLALAIWAGARHHVNDQYPALAALHRRYAVTGSLNPADGHVDAVDGLGLKAGACFGRVLLAPYEDRTPGIAVQTVNTWEDAKARLAPSTGGSERGAFPACDVLIQFVSKQTEPLLNFASHLKPARAVVLVTSDNPDYSIEPARRVKKCLLKNRRAWGGLSATIATRRIESRRLHRAEQDLRALVEEWARKGVAEDRIVLNVTCGNKLMTLAASNVVRGRACPVMYLEFHEKEYSIIGWTRAGSPRPTRFIPETGNPLAGFDPDSVTECLGGQALRK